MERENLLETIYFLESEDETLREKAISILENVPPQKLLPLVPELKWELRKKVASILLHHPDELLSCSQKYLAAENIDLQYWCIRLLGKIHSEESAQTLWKIFQTSKNTKIQETILEALSNLNISVKYNYLFQSLDYISYSLNHRAIKLIKESFQKETDPETKENFLQLIKNKLEELTHKKKMDPIAENHLFWILHLSKDLKLSFSVPYLIELLHSKDEFNLFFLEVICSLEHPESLTAIKNYLQRLKNPKDWFLKKKIFTFLQTSPLELEEDDVSFILNFLEDENWSVQLEVATLLKQYPGKVFSFFHNKKILSSAQLYWLPLILENLEEREEEIFAFINHFLLQVTEEAALNNWIQLSAYHYNNETIDILIQIFQKHHSWYIKKAILKSWEKNGTTKVIPFVSKYLQNSNFHLKTTAQKTLQILENKQI